MKKWLAKIRAKRSNDKIVCFFCNKECAKHESFKLAYKAIDGEGSVTMCPVCALDMEKIRQNYNG